MATSIDGHVSSSTTLENRRAKEPYQLENFKLPDLFWHDLAEVLRLVMASHYSKFLAQEGRFIADQLLPFITRVRRLLDKNAVRQGRSDIQFVLGNVLVTFGEQSGTNQPLEEAVAAYRKALKEQTRERAPLNWAITQNNLGNALQTLGDRKKDATLICEVLGKQLMAWEVFVLGSPYYATLATNNAKRAMAMLKNTFESSVYEACVTQHAEALRRIGLF